jgi:HlyD family secretion protein
MRPQTVAINTSLALVMLAAAVGAVLQVDDPSQHKPVQATAVVSEGPVTTTVSAAGNIGSPRTVGLPFAGVNPGLVRGVYVTVGQTVEPGDKLASVDDRSARNQLAHAKANVAAAE